MTRGPRIVLTLAVTVGCLCASPSVQRTIAQSPPADDIERPHRISADVTIKRSFSRRDAPGALAAPEMQYRWDQIRKGSRWKTTFTVVSIGRQPVETLDGPVALQEISKVARIEDEGDGTPIRVFDHNGEPISAPRLGNAEVLGDVRPNAYKLPPRPSLPLAGSPTRVEDSEDLEMLLFARARQSARREALERRLGRSVGRVEGKDQYLKQDKETVLEVLTDPEWALPVETNVLRNGELILHTTFSYDPRDNASVVARTIRSERHLASGLFQRAVTEVHLSNVDAEWGR
jgi:hypothetical protein